MSILPTLGIIDSVIFHAVNRLPHTPITDILALTLSGSGTYGLLFVGAAAILFLLEEERDHLFMFPLTASIMVTYVVIELLAKPFFSRLRPVYTQLATIQVQYPWGNESYSFPSGHAAFAFALLAILVPRFRKYTWFFMVMAVLISFTRIYLGRHFPSDVVVGAIMGYCIGAGIRKLWETSPWAKSPLKYKSGKLKR
ncbi:hypothetical protein A2154_01235 [Candidatus Gottesmanbacteria bacterium RBG_16_43_7]|uniref:Phosphatidic acid phosphatase type 2/haloperoxidase domain-containing protein n=1 Tax=Candidatus Gottesmanbacteria bacterium RBG_16_43_7 TaxID=1798373 RepID=A0A1F5Z8G4_9BACT|nr:MAG: hypothetical protein A2154_01235 [Candidatus Gottesmanbacteria bacterium RBG_16_43_7]